MESLIGQERADLEDRARKLKLTGNWYIRKIVFEERELRAQLCGGNKDTKNGQGGQLLKIECLLKRRKRETWKGDVGSLYEVGRSPSDQLEKARGS